ncbi:SIR2 family NAD-dependent protein deacylase [Pseudomonas serbica]|uniref:SIR2 family NAD-dependent protein deacylase n=1 Tax=Pseudomonas serbica TaxID=2965074 RepID=UPI00237B90CB|nr:Sir2 family NAD-dependent protein deacetylase [Pseudomonas serbica]
MKVMMITGAGISTGAGLSTYRGKDGRYTEIEEQVGMPIERLLTPRTLKSDPALVWKYWLEFSVALQSALPSPAHHAIVEISKVADEFLEATQNVDGLSHDAGLPASQLIELHGTYHKHHCTECRAEHGLILTADMPIPPRCYRCRPKDLVDFYEAPVIRPSVVMFEELLNEDALGRAMSYARTRPDLLVISGTTLQFPYLIEMVGNAAVSGAEILYIDPMAGQYNPMFHLLNPDLRIEECIINIRRKADDVLPSLLEFLKGQKARPELNGKIDPDALAEWVVSIRQEESAEPIDPTPVAEDRGDLDIGQVLDAVPTGLFAKVLSYLFQRSP